MIPLRVRAATAAALLSVLAWPTPAPAAVPAGQAGLVLTIEQQPGPAERIGATPDAPYDGPGGRHGSGNGQSRSVELFCGPDGGSHPRVAEACVALAAADGDPAGLPPSDGLCYQLHRPVMASAAGAWRGRPVQWERRFGNECALELATGPVFAF